MGGRHVPLPKLKALAARLNIAAALEAKPLGFGNYEAKSWLRDVIDRLLADADLLQTHKGQLDEALRLIADTATEKSSTAEVSDELRVRLKTLAAASRRLQALRQARTDMRWHAG